MTVYVSLARAHIGLSRPALSSNLRGRGAKGDVVAVSVPAKPRVWAVSPDERRLAEACAKDGEVTIVQDHAAAEGSLDDVVFDLVFVAGQRS